MDEFLSDAELEKIETEALIELNTAWSVKKDAINSYQRRINAVITRKVQAARAAAVLDGLGEEGKAALKAALAE